MHKVVFQTVVRKVVKLRYLIIFTLNTMKSSRLFITSAFLFLATLASCPLVSAKTTIQAQEGDLYPTQVYNNRGITYAKQGDFELAIADFNQAIQINPNDADAYYNRASIYFQLGKDELAIADYKRVIEIDPNNAEAYYNRGIAYAKIGKDELARTNLEKAKQLFLAQSDADSAEKVDSILRVLL
ncbi:MAG: hypothetical protein RLZZ04_2842 [Cyanobacteriota bacterium]|jgi:Flp pilus assembly protein TadD